MVSLHLEDTHKLRGGGRGDVSMSSASLRGAVFGRAPPHPLVSATDLTTVASVLRGLLVAVGRCNTQVRLSLIYVSGNLLDLRYLGSL